MENENEVAFEWDYALQYGKYQHDACWDGMDATDIVAPNEITVTVTLHEYRSLVEDVATMKERLRWRDEEVKNMLGRIDVLERQAKLLAEYGTGDAE